MNGVVLKPTRSDHTTLNSVDLTTSYFPLGMGIILLLSLSNQLVIFKSEKIYQKKEVQKRVNRNVRIW